MKVLSILALTIPFLGLCASAVAQKTIELWPGKVPGETKPKAEAVISENSTEDVKRIGEVTNPLLEIFTPEQGTGNGIGIIICPGGGYSILAIDKEGYEVAAWFNKYGYTAFVLQYRVPKKREGAFMDIQRAVRIVRQRSGDWNLNPGSVGVMGFSAGANLSARASTLYDKQVYAPVDRTDSVSSRPDFAILIYGGGIPRNDNDNPTPEISPEKTPPVFLFVTADDRTASGSLATASALREANVPVEFHMLPTGGHGYGLREGNRAAVTWPGLAKTWLETLDFK